MNGCTNKKCRISAVLPSPQKNHGKIEHWHQTIKNCVLLENDYLPGNLEHQIRAFVEYYNNHRYHETLSNIATADVYFGRDKTTMRERQEIKNKLLKEDFEKNNRSLSAARDASITVETARN